MNTLREHPQNPEVLAAVPPRSNIATVYNIQVLTVQCQGQLLTSCSASSTWSTCSAWYQTPALSQLPVLEQRPLVVLLQALQSMTLGLSIWGYQLIE